MVTGTIPSIAFNILPYSTVSIRCQEMEEDQAEGRTEQLIEQAYTYLREKTYPDGCSEMRKRMIQKKAAKFEVKDGELYHKQKTEQKGKQFL